ncbi:MAG: hypothetical protein JO272_16410 [Pseudonocardiales bacterium]|nr:hypothetical protein [Pseudonocardiales bacterium]
MSAPLPDGVFHLLTADNLVRQTYGIHITICGEDISTSDLPLSCYDENSDDFGRDPAYCPECVREAARFTAEPEQPRPESAARAPTDT